jgi:hypothetical protein
LVANPTNATFFRFGVTLTCAPSRLTIWTSAQAGVVSHVAIIIPLGEDYGKVSE